MLLAFQLFALVLVLGSERHLQGNRNLSVLPAKSSCSFLLPASHTWFTVRALWLLFKSSHTWISSVLVIDNEAAPAREPLSNLSGRFSTVFSKPLYVYPERCKRYFASKCEGHSVLGVKKRVWGGKEGRVQGVYWMPFSWNFLRESLPLSHSLQAPAIIS